MDADVSIMYIYVCMYVCMYVGVRACVCVCVCVYKKTPSYT